MLWCDAPENAQVNDLPVLARHSDIDIPWCKCGLCQSLVLQVAWLLYRVIIDFAWCYTVCCPITSRHN